MSISTIFSTISTRRIARVFPSFSAIVALILLVGLNPFSARASCPEIIIVNESPAGAIGYVILDLKGDTLVYRPYGGAAPSCPLTVGEMYQIRPFRPFRDMNGVTTYDMIETARYILGHNNTWNLPEEIAADVNRTYSVTVADILLTREFILEPERELEHRLTWEFFREDAAVFPLPPGVLVNGLFVYSGPGQEIPFVSIKIGRTRQPEKYYYPGYPMEGSIQLEVEDISLIPGQTYDIPVKVVGFDSILGFQFALNLQKTAIDYLGMNSVLTFVHNGLSSLQKGLVITQWMSGGHLPPISVEDGEVIFNIQFKAKMTGKLSQFMAIEPHVVLAQAYDADDGFWNIDMAFTTEFTGNNGTSMAAFSDPSHIAPSGQFNGENNAAITRFDDGALTTFKLHEAMPNPLVDRTRIGMTIPAKGEMQWMVRDVQGKVVADQLQQVHRGYNEFYWEAAGLTSGMYFMTVKYAGQTLTKTLVLE